MNLPRGPFPEDKQMWKSSRPTPYAYDEAATINTYALVGMALLAIAVFALTSWRLGWF
jgi:hypothetical protein